MELTNALHALKTVDLPSVSSVHMAAFPDSALTLLGEETVRRYYDWQLNGPHEVTALGVFKRERLIGFCIGGRFQDSLLGFLRKNRFFLLCRTASHFWLLAKPVFRERARDGLRIMWLHITRRRRPQPVASSVPHVPSFGILSIAVHPSHQGQGIGKHLMKEAEQIARARGFMEMNLTVEQHNWQAIRFYESLGWVKSPVLPSPGIPRPGLGSTVNGPWNGKMRKVLIFPEAGQ